MSGCVERPRYNYRLILLEPEARGTGKVAVAVLDQRQPILNESVGPDFVGGPVISHAFSKDYIATESGKPLAEDWARVVANGLEKKGFSPVVVPTSPQDRPAEVVQRLHATEAPAQLFFVLYQWHTDQTNARMLLRHEVVLDVMTPAGTTLGEAQLRGTTMLGEFVDAKVATPLAFKTKLEQLLNDRNIVQALSAAMAPASDAPSGAASPPTLSGL